MAALKEKLKQLLCTVKPSVLLSCRPAQPTEVTVSRGLIADIMELMHLYFPSCIVIWNTMKDVIVCRVRPASLKIS